jgi:hypothetical protein
MPNGELRPSRNGARSSATPSPSASRKQRDAVRARHAGAGALHRRLHRPGLDAFALLGPLRRGVSATSTSPFGST